MLEPLITKRFRELDEMLRLELERLQASKEVTVDSTFYRRWATSVLNLLQRVFGEHSIHFRDYDKTYGGSPEQRIWLNRLAGIFWAAKDDYENGYLFTVRSLIKAEVLTGDILAQAKVLLDAHYKDPACLFAGVALESTLKDLCVRSSITFAKANPTIEPMNVELSKAGIYNMAKQKQITAWADLRNKAAHGQWGEYTDADVQYMIEGVERFIADYL